MTQTIPVDVSLLFQIFANLMDEEPTTCCFFLTSEAFDRSPVLYSQQQKN